MTEFLSSFLSLLHNSPSEPVSLCYLSLQPAFYISSLVWVSVWRFHIHLVFHLNRNRQFKQHGVRPPLNSSFPSPLTACPSPVWITWIVFTPLTLQVKAVTSNSTRIWFAPPLWGWDRERDVRTQKCSVVLMRRQILTQEVKRHRWTIKSINYTTRNRQNKIICLGTAGKTGPQLWRRNITSFLESAEDAPATQIRKLWLLLYL